MVKLNEKKKKKKKKKPVQAGKPLSIVESIFFKTERAVMVVCQGRKCGYGGECLAG